MNKQQPRMKLTSPTQVRVLKSLEVNLDRFEKGDVITIEDHLVDRLLDKGYIEELGEKEVVESINRFSVDEDPKDPAAVRKMNEALAGETDDEEEVRTLKSPKATAVNADAVTNSNTKTTTKGAAADTGTTATPRP